MKKVIIKISENEVIDLMATLTTTKFSILCGLRCLDEKEDAETIEMGKRQLQNVDNLMAAICRAEFVEKD